MIGDLFNNNKRRDVCTRVGQKWYLGKKYAIEKSTGYYVCTTGKRRRLHVVMWEHEHGEEVGDGYVIHHIDWDKTHNVIENLVRVTIREHELIHTPPSDLRKLSEEDRIIYEDLIKRSLIKNIY
ncbi:MAG: HNH endonuclease [Anaeroplasmataceae bacterium]|nr:HNH endonuclease [Anaeroplasmataceae bacterium]